MSNSKNLKFMFVCLLGLLGMAVIVQAAEQDQYQKSEQGTRQMMGQTQQGYMGQAKLCSIDKINDAKVVDNKNETIGSVKDVILDNDQHRIQYVIVSADNMLHPVPWSAFDTSKMSMQSRTDRTAADSNMSSRETNKSDQNSMSSWLGMEKNVLTLNISKDQLHSAPSIDSVDISAINNSSLKQKIDEFYSRFGSSSQSWQGQDKSRQMGQVQNRMDTTARQMDTQRDMSDSNVSTSMGQRQRDMTAGTSMQTGQGNLFKASDLLGLNIHDNSDKTLGEIKDIVVDLKQGSLAYCLVSFGGTLGMGKDIAAVPWSSINIQPDLKVAKLDATTDTLKTAVIDEKNLAQLSQPQFARKIHESFGATPYWEVYGYVPGTAAEAGSMDAWRAGSKFNQKFDASKMTTIQGKIENVSTFEPERGAAPGVQLKVRTTDNETVTVYVGPQNYLTQQGINFRTGSDIKVTGAKVREGFKHVIMASDVDSAGKTIRLRDAQGNPQWQTESMQGESMYKKGEQKERQNRSNY